jgi:protocatechuate 3,4-dioxygenase, beta subunit
MELGGTGQGMPSLITPRLISRRSLGPTGLAMASSVVLPAARTAMSQPHPLPVTPRQTAGPFYPVDWSGDADADLVRVAGEAARAQGTVTHLRGRVLDSRGEPVGGAVVEIWQCDAFGRYRHPRDRQDGRDAGFQGRGRVAAAPDGGFAFRTIRPVAYPGRTPHIHVAVAAPGQRDPLVTQLYVAGEPLNERDGLFNTLRDQRQRDAVLLHLEPADRVEPGALLAARDIVLG